MPVSIIANTAARYAQNSLSAQNEAVTKGTLRMTSGQRVLSAADDASAMAIGTSLKIENSGLRSAMLNATSATSMLQIADGALGQISELMSRLSVLAVQAASGQYDDATRVLLDGEFQGLKQEIDRLANSTSFNNVKILAGTPEFELASGVDMAADGVRGIRFDTSVMNTDSSFRYSYDAASERLTLTKIGGGTTVSQSLNLTPLLNGSVGAGVDLQGSQTLELGFSQLGVTMTLGAGFMRGTDIGNGYALNDGGVMTVAASSFVLADKTLPAAAVNVLTALGGGIYDAVTGALDLPTTSDGTVLTLDGQPGLSYAVNGGAVGAVGADSPDLAAAGPTVVDVYATSGTSRVLVGRVTLGDTTSPAIGAGTIGLNVTPPANGGIPPAIVDDLTALVGGVYNATTGALTLPTASDGAAVTLAATAGISYGINGAAAGTSGAASPDLVGAGPITVDVYVDNAAGGKTLLGRLMLGEVTATGPGAGSLTMDVGGGLLTATGTGDVAPRHLTYKVGTGVLAGEDTIGVDVPAMTLRALGLDMLSITNSLNAESSIDAVKDAMAVLNQGRAAVGAQQIRLEAVGRNLGVISDNNEAARSSMIDVDVSKEISDLTNNQTLMQASIAMLSRANQMPDILLELLRS